jgi:hypothetical protein
MEVKKGNFIETIKESKGSKVKKENCIKEKKLALTR